MPDNDKRLGDQPIEPQYAKEMKDLARAIDEFFNGDRKPKKTGFILMVFPFEDHGGRCNYMSNADRRDVVVMLEEQLARFEGQPELTGSA